MDGSLDDVMIVRTNGVKILPVPNTTPENPSPYYQSVSATNADTIARSQNEINRHFRKRGDQYLHIPNWVMVIDEEWGEAIRALNQRNYAEARKEIIETIACCVRLLNEVEAVEAGGRPGVTYHVQD